MLSHEIVQFIPLIGHGNAENESLGDLSESFFIVVENT